MSTTGEAKVEAKTQKLFTLEEVLELANDTIKEYKRGCNDPAERVVYKAFKIEECTNCHNMVTEGQLINCSDPALCGCRSKYCSPCANLYSPIKQLVCKPCRDEYVKYCIMCREFRQRHYFECECGICYFCCPCLKCDKCKKGKSKEQLKKCYVKDCQNLICLLGCAYGTPNVVGCSKHIKTKCDGCGTSASIDGWCEDCEDIFCKNCRLTAMCKCK